MDDDKDFRELLADFEEAVCEAERDCHFATVPRWMAACVERDRLREVLIARVEADAFESYRSTVLDMETRA